MSIPRQDEAKLLSEVDVLKSLSEEEVAELARELPDTHLQAGQLLYTPRERGEELFLLKSGRVRVYEAGTGGEEFTFSVVGAGTIFGEMGLGPRRLRVGCARALEPSLVARLGRDQLEDIIRKNPEVGVDLVRLLSRRLRLFAERMADFASKDVTARLASLILHLVESEGLVSSEGYTVPNRYTHEQLGTMVGARRVAVSRAFARLREIGAVKQRDRHIYVVDMEALEHAARVKR